MKKEILSESYKNLSYEKTYSCAIVKIETTSKKEFVFKFSTEQGNSYDHLWIYNFAKDGKWDLFAGINEIPLEFETSFMSKDEKRIADHKRIIKEAIDFVCDLVEKF